MWKREIYDFLGSDSHGVVSLRSLSKINRDWTLIECFFVKDAVHIEGETSRYDSTADTGTIITRYFCPNCGSRLFGTSSANTNIISVTAGTLDDSSWFKPNAIVYNKRRPAWEFMDESVPVFEDMLPVQVQK